MLGLAYLEFMSMGMKGQRTNSPARWGNARRLSTLAATFVVVACGAEAVCAPPCAAQGQSEPSTAVEQWIERAFDPELVPGIAVAVVRGDEVVYLGGHGMADVAAGRPVTPNTSFYIASVTKSFLGLAAAILDDRDAIDLDVPVSAYLPQLEFSSSLDADAISMRSLLTHTHGIDGDAGGVTFRLAYTGMWDHDLLLDLLSDADPREGGDPFSYSNTGYNVAGLALDQHLKASWKDVLAWEVFRPLGMVSTTGFVSRVEPTSLAQPYGLEPSGPQRIAYGKSDANMHSAGGLVTTAADLALWLEANLNAGVVDGEQRIPAAAIAEAHRPVVSQTTDPAQGFGREQYSLGLHHGEYDGERFVHHFGGFSGFHAHVSYMPDQQIGVAVLANTAGGGAWVAGAVAKGIYAILLDRPDLEERFTDLLDEMASNKGRAMTAIRRDRERRASRPQRTPRPLQDYAGVYSHPTLGLLEFLWDGSRLTARAGVATSDVEVFDGESYQLRVQIGGGGSVVTFEFPDEGPAEALVILGDRFERTN